MDDISGLPEFWKEFSSLGQEVDYFVTARLFDGTPAVWPQELNYIKWRHLVATELGVDPMAVQLVGSARLGYSMNPKKNFRKFHEGSDFDIAVISPELSTRHGLSSVRSLRTTSSPGTRTTCASWFSRSALPSTSCCRDFRSASSGHGPGISSSKISETPSGTARSITGCTATMGRSEAIR